MEVNKMTKNKLDINSIEIVDEIHKRIKDMNEKSKLIKAKENNLLRLEDKAKNKKAEITKYKNEIEMRLNETDISIKDTYKYFLADVKDSSSIFDAESLDYFEISNILFSINLLRELIDGKSSDVDIKAKELMERENELNTKLSSLDCNKMGTYKNLLEEYNEGDPDNRNSLKKSSLEFNRMKSVNIAGYLDEIQTSINKMKNEINNRRINTHNDNKILNTKCFNIKTVNSLMQLEKEHNEEMMLKTQADNFLIDNRDFFEEYLFTNDLAYTDTTVKNKKPNHIRSNSLPMFTDTDLIYNPQTMNKRMFKNESTSIIKEKKEILINRSKPNKNCLQNSVNKNCVKRRIVTDVNNKNFTRQVNNSERPGVDKNSVKLKWNNSNNSSSKHLNSSYGNKLTNTNSPLIQSQRGSVESLSQATKSYKSNFFIENKAKYFLKSKNIY